MSLQKFYTQSERWGFWVVPQWISKKLLWSILIDTMAALWWWDCTYSESLLCYAKAIQCRTASLITAVEKCKWGDQEASKTANPIRHSICALSTLSPSPIKSCDTHRAYPPISNFSIELYVFVFSKRDAVIYITNVNEDIFAATLRSDKPDKSIMCWWRRRELEFEDATQRR